LSFCPIPRFHTKLNNDRDHELENLLDEIGIVMLSHILNNASPLRIKQVEILREDSHSCDACEVVYREVTPHPLHDTTSIETVIERKDTLVRVVIYSGPEAPQKRVLASYQWTETSSSVCCAAWTSFPEDPQHQLLCVLQDSSTIAIYDVFPESEFLYCGGAGHYITLPFDSCSIYSISPHGLLISRNPDAQDVCAVSMEEDDDDEYDGFFLQPPPRLSRQQAVEVDTFEGPLASLFSLAHPLQEVLPVSLSLQENSFSSKIFTDALESIIWVGTTRWMSLKGSVESQIMVVSYHLSTRKHTVWLMHEAPPPPAPTPLYQRHTTATHSIWTDPILWPDHDSNTWPVQSSHEQALADALGVRKGPRASEGVSRPSLRANETLHRSALLSPTSHDHSQMLMSPTAATMDRQISARLALHPIYHDDRSCQEHASQILLVTDVQMTGTLVLCLYHKAYHTLDLFNIDPKAWKIQPLTSVTNCLATQAVVTAASEKGDRVPVTDLLLQVHDQLILLRANLPICVCCLDGYGEITSISDSVRDRVTIRTKLHSLRSTVNLQCSNHFVENAIQAMSYALFPKFAASFALAIRVDTLLLAQKLEGILDDCEDPEWLAFSTLWTVILEFHLFGTVLTEPHIPEPEDSWETLLHSDYHRWHHSEHPILLSTDLRPDSCHLRKAKEALIALHPQTLHISQDQSIHVVSTLFLALHMLYEDTKLSPTRRQTETARLASILGRACLTMLKLQPQNSKLHSYLLQYQQDIGEKLCQLQLACVPDTQVANITIENLDLPSTPPSITTWIHSILEGKRLSCIYDAIEDINAACVQSRSIARIFHAYSQDTGTHRDSAVVRVLIDEGYDSFQMLLRDITPGVVLPLLEVIHRCRYNPSLSHEAKWSARAWSLVGREDLCGNLEMAKTFTMPKAEHRGKPSNEENDSDGRGGSNKDRDKDGLIQVEYRSAMLFPEDNRVHEACRLLSSSRPVFLRVKRVIGVTDHEYEKMKQSKLILLCRRALALSIGRGMLTYGSLCPNVAEPLPIPELCLKGRLPPTNVLLAMDISDAPPDLKLWPEFHNGAASGLRLVLDTGNDDDDSVFKISRTWIVYNKPPRSSQAQTQTDDGTTESNPQFDSRTHAHGGFLLALGLLGHLTALEMSDIYEYLTQGSITTTVGVLLGMAANMRGSCDMAVSKMLCLHIPSLIPQHFSAIDVASTVQSAAIAGTGLLYLGSSHRMMTEFLLNEIGKRPDNDVSAQDREAYTLSCGIALGMVNLSLEDPGKDVDRAAGIADLRVEERLNRYIHGGEDEGESRRARESNDRFSLPSTVHGNEGDKCSLIHEGKLINTDVTAPAAIIALGLMYLKSGNMSIAAGLSLPETHFLLEFVRPDFLGLRIIAKALILWDEVMPTQLWLEEQIPAVITRAYKDMRTIALNALEGHDLAPRRFEFDRRAVRQIYAHIISGACFGLGLRFAGTGNAKAKEVIMNRVKELNGLRDASDPISAAIRPEIPILETCLGTAAIALSLVMAGTGDLDTLRLLKVPRWRCDIDMRYGNHMIYAMATGLVFIGGGRYTIGREPSDIAALLAAFYPRFPVSSSDNQFHLQALRHLYALAVHKKEMCAVDIDSGECVYVDVEMKESTGHSQKLTLPCMIRNTESPIVSFKVISDDYYPLTFRIKASSIPNAFYVKRKISHVHHVQIPLKHSIQYKLPMEIADEFQGNPFFATFAHYICTDNHRSPYLASVYSRRNSMILSRTFAWQSDSEDAFAVYLALLNTLQLVASGSQAATPLLRDLRLICTHYRRTTSSKRLLQTELLAYLIEATEKAITESPRMAFNASVYYEVMGA
jgi:hypothetical protein